MLLKTKSKVLGMQSGRSRRHTLLAGGAIVIASLGGGAVALAQPGSGGDPQPTAEELRQRTVERKAALRASAVERGYGSANDPMLAFAADCLTAEGHDARYDNERDGGSLLYSGDPKAMMACLNQLAAGR